MEHQKEKQKTKQNPWETRALIGYSALSVVMGVVSLLVFNPVVFVLDVAVIALAAALVLSLKMHLLTVESGVLHIPVYLLSCVLWFRSRVYHVVSGRLVIFTAVLAALVALLVFVTRFWKETKRSRGLLALIIFVMMFLTAGASVTLANAMFDTSEKEVYSCPIAEISTGWDGSATVALDSFYGDERKFDIKVAKADAQGLSVGDTVDVTVGSGFLGLDYFTVN